MKLFGKEFFFIFQRPPKSKIVIFDEANSHYITNYILPGISTFTYKIRSPNYYVSFSIFYLFIKTLSDFNWHAIKKRKKIHAFGKEILCHYHLGCLQFINPKVIITLSDNSSFYHWLCNRYKDAQFFAIQNGNRTNKQLDNEINQYHQHFFCFGNYETDKYAQYDHKIQYSHPVGSLLGGYYTYRNRNKNNPVKSFEIGIVSQFNEGMLNKEKILDPIFLESLNLMHTYCARYIFKKNNKAVVLLRKSKDDKSEIQYLKKYYHDNVTYRFNDREKFSTYKGMEQSEVVISFFSTSSIEAFGWGKKILHCDFTASNQYNDYDPMIMFTEPNYDAFEMRLDLLRNEPYKHYKERTKGYSSYLMNNNPELPPHIYIRNKLKKYILKSI